MIKIELSHYVRVLKQTLGSLSKGEEYKARSSAASEGARLVGALRRSSINNHPQNPQNQCQCIVREILIVHVCLSVLGDWVMVRSEVKGLCELESAGVVRETHQATMVQLLEWGQMEDFVTLEQELLLRSQKAQCCPY